MLSSLVSLLLLSGKRRTQNLQNADIFHCQPQERQNTTDEVRLRLFWSIYEHSTQYFDLNMNLRIFPYKSFKFRHTDCLRPLCKNKKLRKCWKQLKRTKLTKKLNLQLPKHLPLLLLTPTPKLPPLKKAWYQTTPRRVQTH